MGWFSCKIEKIESLFFAYIIPVFATLLLKDTQERYTLAFRGPNATITATKAFNDPGKSLQRHLVIEPFRRFFLHTMRVQ